MEEILDCKTVGFSLKISKEIGKVWRKSLKQAKRARGKNRIFSVSPQSHSPFSALFQTFCLTARAYLNTYKYGLFCSLRKYSPFLKHQDKGGRGLKLGDLLAFPCDKPRTSRLCHEPSYRFFFIYKGQSQANF